MRTTRLLILLALFLAAGCGKFAPAATPLVLPSLTPPPTATPTPPPTPTTAAVSTPSVALMIDDFEAGETAWLPGTADVFSDSSSLSVALTAGHASRGKQALQLNFDLSDKPKAIFYLDKAMDFSKARTLRLDIYNPGTVGGVGVSFTTGPDAVWYESDSYPAAKGQTTTLVFDLNAGTYKAASTNWEFRASIADLNSLSRLAVIIYPAQGGSAYLDNVYLSDTPPTK